MANILEFQPRPARQGRAAETRGMAQIVIFPGIRYERLDAETAPPKRRPVRRRASGTKTLRQG